MSDQNQPPQGGQYPPQGPPPGGYQQPGPYNGGPQGPTSPDAKGFFAALFDLSFTSFVTLKFAKFIYVLIMVVLALLWLGWIIAGFSTEPLLGVLVLVLGWIPILLYVILARVTLEFYIAMVRTSQNTAATKVEVENLRGELRR